MTAGLGAFFLSMPQRLLQPTTSVAPAIQVALETEPTPPSPSPPAPDPPTPTPPKVQRVVHREIRKPDPVPLMTAELSSPAVSEASFEQSPAAAVKEPSLRRAPAGDIESQYAATLRTNIDSRTSLPTSAEYRLLKPHGEVRVNFTLDRSGMLLASDLARSSGSALLDRHALEIVRAGRYPPFPSDAFQGEFRHTFLITLEFHS